MIWDTLRTVGNVVGMVGILAAVALTILFLAPGAVGAEASYVVLSDSMSPHIQAGDVVVVRSVDSETLSEGDVITYEVSRGGESDRVTHRIVSVEETAEGRQFRTKGDANEETDENLVAETAVIGRVWFHVPMIGKLLTFATTDTGLVAFVVVPSILLVTNEVYTLYRDASPEDDATEDDTTEDQAR